MLRDTVMRTSDQSAHSIDKLLVSFNSEVANEDATMMRTRMGHWRSQSQKIRGYSQPVPAEAALVSPLRNIDDVHRTVAGTQRTIHRRERPCPIGWLPTLIAVCWRKDGSISSRVAVEAGDADQTIVRGIARNLGCLRNILQDDFVATGPAAVSIKNNVGCASSIDHGTAVGRNCDAGKRTRRLDLAEQFPLRQIDHRDSAVFSFGVEPLSVARPSTSRRPRPRRRPARRGLVRWRTARACARCGRACRGWSCGRPCRRIRRAPGLRGTMNDAKSSHRPVADRTSTPMRRE